MPVAGRAGTSSAVVVKGRTFVVVVAGHSALGVARSRDVPGYMSRTVSERGRAQQLSTWPSDGAPASPESTRQRLTAVA